MLVEGLHDVLALVILKDTIQLVRDSEHKTKITDKKCAIKLFSWIPLNLLEDPDPCQITGGANYESLTNSKNLLKPDNDTDPKPGPNRRI